MKLAFLAGQNSIHTIKWVNEMAKRGHAVNLITMHQGDESLHDNVLVYRLPFSAPVGYYANVLHLRKILRSVKPDLLNTHYASGYGTLARLSGFRPNLLSVWGSDVYDFPNQSQMNYSILRKNLMAADRIASTSHVMKSQTESVYTPVKEIIVTPFGVDINKFKPAGSKWDGNKIIIGTVKRMMPKYGISNLIEAFALLNTITEKKLELILVGGGPQEEELKILCKKLNVDQKVKFIGPISHHEVPEWLNRFDIYCALSTLDSESFGVAVIEASACSLPVIVSDAGGLPEVVMDGKTGYIVPRNDPEAAAEKMNLLINNESLLRNMGQAGRKHVLKNYQWPDNADHMENVYKIVIDDYYDESS